jgi:divalent metal cation (Fe/Co/Zn/Cd) transporter
MRTFWLYTLARLGIIVGVGLVLFPFLGLNLLMAVAAIVIGALLSYLFLGNMRAKVASDIETRLANRAAKPKRKGADEAAEDEIVDERISEEEHSADDSADDK